MLVTLSRRKEGRRGRSQDASVRLYASVQADNQEGGSDRARCAHRETRVQQKWRTHGGQIIRQGRIGLRY